MSYYHNCKWWERLLAIAAPGILIGGLWMLNEYTGLFEIIRSWGETAFVEYTFIILGSVALLVFISVVVYIMWGEATDRTRLEGGKNYARLLKFSRYVISLVAWYVLIRVLDSWLSPDENSLLDHLIVAFSIGIVVGLNYGWFKLKKWLRRDVKSGCEG